MMLLREVVPEVAQEVELWTSTLVLKPMVKRQHWTASSSSQLRQPSFPMIMMAAKDN